MDNTFWINYNGQKFDINYKIISSLSDSILMMKLCDVFLVRRFNIILINNNILHRSVDL